MSWNYRVVREEHPVGDQIHESWSIREVHYREDGTISGWTAKPCHPGGDDKAELVTDYHMMARAFTLPVVDVSSGEAVELLSEISFAQPAKRVEP